MWSTHYCVCRPGNDPLIDEESNHDINSVAGVLKLYFRGLENPLFPNDRFNDLISCVREYHRGDTNTDSARRGAALYAVVVVIPTPLTTPYLPLSLCVSAAGIENLYERAQCVRKILLGVPRATLVVMRYLFAFLNQ